MRDTDSDWSFLGDNDPYYGVMSQPRFRIENITPETIEEFYDSGHGDINHFLNQIRRTYPDFSPRTALDFGCGAGRLTLAIAKHVQSVTGVDIAPGMLKLAEDRARAKGIDSVSFVDTIPEQSFDWVNTHIVLQHIPPSRGYGIIERLVNSVAPGGAISIGVAIYKERIDPHDPLLNARAFTFDGEVARVLEPDANPNGTMHVYDYDLNRVIRLIYKAKIYDPIVQYVEHGGCIFFGRKH